MPFRLRGNRREKCLGGHYEVSVKNIEDGSISVYQTKHFVMGTGSEPLIPAEIDDGARQDTMVSTEYLFRKDELAERRINYSGRLRTERRGDLF